MLTWMNHVKMYWHGIVMPWSKYPINILRYEVFWNSELRNADYLLCAHCNFRDNKSSTNLYYNQEDRSVLVTFNELICPGVGSWSCTYIQSISLHQLSIMIQNAQVRVAHRDLKAQVLLSYTLCATNICPWMKHLLCLHNRNMKLSPWMDFKKIRLCGA